MKNSSFSRAPRDACQHESTIPDAEEGYTIGWGSNLAPRHTVAWTFVRSSSASIPRVASFTVMSTQRRTILFMLHHLTFPEGSDVETNCETTLVPHHVGTKSVSHNHGHPGVGSHSDIVQLHHINGRGSVWVRHWHHHRPSGIKRRRGASGPPLASLRVRIRKRRSVVGPPLAPP